ncbi:MAG: hypothetical protein JXQ27_05010 [Acidobacteria bacterium]|nr:hypothetical protein [Acidobacteriota bacterium]
MDDQLRRDFAACMLGIYLGRGPGSFRETLEKYIWIIWDDCGHDEHLLNVYLFAFFSDMLLLLHRTDRVGFLQDQLEFSAFFLPCPGVAERISGFIDAVAGVLGTRSRREIEDAFRLRSGSLSQGTPGISSSPLLG